MLGSVSSSVYGAYGRDVRGMAGGVAIAGPHYLASLALKVTMAPRQSPLGIEVDVVDASLPGTVRPFAEIPFSALVVWRTAIVCVSATIPDDHSSHWHALSCHPCPTSTSNLVKFQLHVSVWWSACSHPGASQWVWGRQSSLVPPTRQPHHMFCCNLLWQISPSCCEPGLHVLGAFWSERRLLWASSQPCKLCGRSIWRQCKKRAC